MSSSPEAARFSAQLLDRLTTRVEELWPTSTHLVFEGHARDDDSAYVSNCYAEDASKVTLGDFQSVDRLLVWHAWEALTLTFGNEWDCHFTTTRTGPGHFQVTKNKMIPSKWGLPDYDDATDRLIVTPGETWTISTT